MARVTPMRFGQENFPINCVYIMSFRHRLRDRMHACAQFWFSAFRQQHELALLLLNTMDTGGEREGKEMAKRQWDSSLGFIFSLTNLFNTSGQQNPKLGKGKLQQKEKEEWDEFKNSQRQKEGFLHVQRQRGSLVQWILHPYGSLILHAGPKSSRVSFQGASAEVMNPLPWPRGSASACLNSTLKCHPTWLKWGDL